ncbi:MAG TPA: nucleoside-diphosphate sugar epimerase/dehydratase [Candidatus Binatia bacterium]|jgi:FlaA1/EpsC-like NDP-sugar epimerase|nr:nucleoside-diphosphate sugar epimerase/dehydratase [Candidatus Binatia bacterium]
MRATRLNFVLSCATALAASLWLGYQVRFNFAVPEDTASTFLLVFTWVIGFKLFCLWRFGQFDALLDYFNLADFSRLCWFLIVPGFVVFGVSTQLGSDYAPPRGVVVADFSFSVLALTALRLAFRQAARARDAGPAKVGPPRQRARRAGIVGAGLVGTALAQEFATRHDLGLQAVAFFDDDRIKWGKHVHNIPVIGAPEILLDDQMNLELEEVIIAMPSAPARRQAEIVRTLQRLRIKFSTVPSIYELTTGQAKVSQLRSVGVQDLLGREQVRLATEDVGHLLRDRVVMVTGAGGSIGSELCRQIASYLPRSLLLVEQSEAQLFQIEQELINAGWGNRLVPLAANVQDESRLEHIFRQYRPEAVFHAAAHKHVPLMESQPGEALKNNALGTLRLAETCLRHGTERFILISTDKAINPTSVMGASKRLAEMCVQSLHAANPAGTRFMAVRFGNVLGSSGSVVPIFNKQIAAGGPVKVTHPDMRRYFMTITEAVGLVLQTAGLGAGGEIFLLDMGKPVKIVDLARQLIELSGFIPDRDIRIEFTGLRPGEKLFEELRYHGEEITPTRHPKIMRLLCEPTSYQRVRDFLLHLAGQADHLGPEDIKSLLKSAVPEYQPDLKPFLNGAPYPGEALAAAHSNDKPNGHKPVSAAGVADTLRYVAPADAAR